MDNIDITVVIPVKNMDKYIKKCIDSILVQNERMELIIIDFGSTDNTINIINSYNDSRINLQKVNLDNVAEARNEGIELARGKFLSFIDADDWISEKYYNKVIKEMEEKRADIGVTEYMHVDEQNNAKSKKFYNEYFGKDIELNLTFFRDVGIGKVNCECWNKVYRTSFIKQANIKFDDTFGINGEDLLYNYELYLKQPKIVFIKDIVYYHLLRKKSLGKTSETYVGKRFNYIVTKIMEKSEKKMNIEFLELYISLMLQCIINKKRYKSKQIEYNALIDNQILDIVPLSEILKSPYINCKRKIISIILKKNMKRIFILLTYL